MGTSTLYYFTGSTAFRRIRFNWTVNNGLEHQKRVVVDFGKVATDKEKVAGRVASKAWLQARSYEKDMSEELKTYYRNTWMLGLHGKH